MTDKKLINFGSFETESVLINIFIVKIFLGLPGELAKKAATAGWLVATVSSVIFLAFLFLFLRFFGKIMEKDIISLAENVLKKPLMQGFAVFASLSFLAKAALSVKISADVIVLAIPFELPALICTALFVIAALFCAFKGKETVIRTHAFFVPLLLLVFVFVIFLSNESKSVSNLYPIFGFGTKNILMEGIKNVGIYSDFLYIFLLAPYVRERKIFNKAAFWGVAISSITIILLTFSYSLVVPYPASTRLFMPIYQVSRLVGGGTNSQGYEAFLLPFWIISSLLYISLSLYFAAFFINRAFNIKKDKLLLLFFAPLIFLAANIPQSTTQAAQLGARFVTPTVFAVSFSAVLIIVANKCRKRRKICKKN